MTRRILVNATLGTKPRQNDAVMTISEATARATLAGHDERLTNVPTDQAVLMLPMLAGPTRLRLLWELRDCELGVSTLAQAAECTPTAVSKHLWKMRMAGLVRKRADDSAPLSPSGEHVLRLLAKTLVQADLTVARLPLADTARPRRRWQVRDHDTHAPSSED